MITALPVNHIIPFSVRNGVGDGADMYKLKIDIPEGQREAAIETAKAILVDYAAERNEQVKEFMVNEMGGGKRVYVNAVVAYFRNSQRVNP